MSIDASRPGVPEDDDEELEVEFYREESASLLFNSAESSD
jgi:hypothetical protein